MSLSSQAPVAVPRRGLPLLRPPRWLLHSAALLPLFLLCLVALHLSLLRLPYFWDEAGYYVPAARDLLLTGRLIPQTTIANPHPPLLSAYLALAWKLFSYSPGVTRGAMLLVAAFALLGVFRLACRLANLQVAAAATLLTAFYPVFFAQSSLAHADLPAAAFILWGLLFYLKGRPLATAIVFTLAALVKETAILVPLALLGWEAFCHLLPFLAPRARSRAEAVCLFSRWRWARAASLLFPVLPLALWFVYLGRSTGHLLGNPEFVRYNLLATLNPTRIAAALLTRLWQMTGYLNLFVLTVTTLLALLLPPLPEPSPAGLKRRTNGNPVRLRPRIALPAQMALAVLIVVHIAVLSVLGGAVLARYLLPVLPLLIILCVSTLRRRVPWWPAFVGIALLAFLLALVFNPPYRFAPEDNLAYADYVRLHQQAADWLVRTYPGRRVLTVWPASDELTKTYLGYVPVPLPVLRIEDFSPQQIMAAEQASGQFDVALVFSLKYDPGPRSIPMPEFWERIQRRFFGYYRDLPPQVLAEMLHGRLVYQRSHAGQWVAVVTLDRIENARLR